MMILHFAPTCHTIYGSHDMMRCTLRAARVVWHLLSVCMGAHSYLQSEKTLMRDEADGPLAARSTNHCISCLDMQWYTRLQIIQMHSSRVIRLESDTVKRLLDNVHHHFVAVGRLQCNHTVRDVQYYCPLRVNGQFFYSGVSPARIRPVQNPRTVIWPPFILWRRL